MPPLFYCFSHSKFPFVLLQFTLKSKKKSWILSIKRKNDFLLTSTSFRDVSWIRRKEPIPFMESYQEGCCCISWYCIWWGKVPKVNRTNHRGLDSTYYQSVIGSQIYAMLCTRPDIAFTISQLSQFNSCPTTAHLAVAKDVSDISSTCLIWDSHSVGALDYNMRHMKGVHMNLILYVHCNNFQLCRTPPWQTLLLRESKRNIFLMLTLEKYLDLPKRFVLNGKLLPLWNAVGKLFSISSRYTSLKLSKNVDLGEPINKRLPSIKITLFYIQ